MKNEVFDKYYRQLNKQQKDAVDSIEGPVMVVAGPGTGKTQILTLRIANILLKTQINPENILALTFTESGVASMRKRLTQIVGNAAYGVSIMTFHGFANEVIREYPEAFPEIVGANSATEMEQIDVLRDVIDKSKLKILKPFGDRFHYVKSARSAIKDLKQEGVSPQHLADLVKEERKSFDSIDDLIHEKGQYKGRVKGKYQNVLRDIDKNAELAVVYGGYETELASRKLFDYEDMIIRVLAALDRDKDLLLTLQERYHYLLVDEHQDTNRAQNLILELLANFHQSPNLFVVGDEKQAIYRFQGASLENFMYFKNLYADAKLISLKMNYRSTQNILDVAHGLMEGRNSEPLVKFNDYEELPIDVASYSSPDVERYSVATAIVSDTEAGVLPSEIAVLYRQNAEAQNMSAMLGKLGVPHVIESDQNVLSDSEIEKLLLVFRAVNSYGNELHLVKAMHVNYFNIPTLDIYKITQERKEMFKTIASAKRMGELDIEDPQALNNLSQNLSRWNVMANNSSLDELFEDVVRNSGMLSFLTSGEVQMDKLDKLRLLHNQVQQLNTNKRATLTEFLRHIDTLIDHNISIKYKPQFHISSKVRLMTAHRSKGQEFEHVYILNAVDKHWGNRRRFSSFKLPKAMYLLSSKPKEDQQWSDNDDERNLFYVSLTRAKKRIHISMSQAREDGREQLASQFVGELKPKLVSTINTTDNESGFLNAAGVVFAATKEKAGYSVRDKEFLNELFYRRGFSATHLNNYLNCPWRYFYQNLLRIPQAQSAAQIYGTAVHRALEEQINKVISGEKIESSYMITVFTNAINDSVIKESDKPDYLDRGINALEGYSKEYSANWSTKALPEFSIKGIDLGNNIRLTGKLDRIDLLNGKDVNVVDYKTGAPKSRNFIEGNTKDSNGDYKRQLVFYQLLLDKYEDKKYNMISGEIDFVEPTDAGKYRKEKFEITFAETADLIKQIEETAQSILDLKFWDSTCEKKDCDFCSLRNLSV